jgi:hypothetical protein
MKSKLGKRLISQPIINLSIIECITINAPVFFYGAGSNGFLAGNMHYEGQL